MFSEVVEKFGSGFTYELFFHGNSVYRVFIATREKSVALERGRQFFAEQLVQALRV